MLPLPFADVDVDVIIARISGTDEVRRHLSDIGFVPGASVKLISVAGENVIVALHESRVAISAEFAKRIMVK